MDKHDAASAGKSGDQGADLLSDPAESTARVLAKWIDDHSEDNAAGGIRGSKDGQEVLVYWKGPVPADLLSLATRQPAPVTFKAAPYSRAELTAAVTALMINNPDISAAGSLPDYSGISVALSSKAPSGAFARVQADSSIPIVLHDSVRRVAGCSVSSG